MKAIVVLGHRLMDDGHPTIELSKRLDLGIKLFNKFDANAIIFSGGRANPLTEITEAEVMPFYFSIAIPRGDTNRGLLILQNHGVYGIKSVFSDFLDNYLRDINDDYRLVIGTIAPREYIDRFLNEGILQKIRFIRYNIPNDIAEQIGINNGVDTSFEEYIINKPIGFIRTKGRALIECINGQRYVNNLVEIDNFEYDNIKLEFKLGRKTKVIDLSNIDKLVLNEDITDRVDLIGGHPTHVTIMPVIVETLNLYMECMGIIRG